MDDEEAWAGYSTIAIAGEDIHEIIDDINRQTRMSKGLITRRLIKAGLKQYADDPAILLAD